MAITPRPNLIVNPDGSITNVPFDTNTVQNNPPDPEVPSDKTEQTSVVSINTQPDPLETFLDGYNAPPELDTTSSLVQQAEDPYANSPELDPTSSLVQQASPAPAEDPYANSPELDTTSSLVQQANPGFSISNVISGVFNAKKQPSRSAVGGVTTSSNDWRVRLQLAQNADYLYKATPIKTIPNSGPGILAPLAATDGVIFPYTPKIDVGFKANYQTFDLTHSNYKSYFYQSSNVDPINITAFFTAQNTQDANYLLAVIHFFKSVSKMFYGQDPKRGAPPPLLFLSGLGQYQFNKHPCVLTSFNYSLPDDVDYIRANTVNQAGSSVPLGGVTNALSNLGTTGAYSAISRLTNAGATIGAVSQVGSLLFGFPATNAPQPPTYVPTKMTITIQLLPVVSRQKVSTQFSLANYANGNGLKGGFW